VLLSLRLLMVFLMPLRMSLPGLYEVDQMVPMFDRMLYVAAG